MDFFDARRLEFSQALDVRFEGSSNAIVSPRLARGSEGPRGLLAYYFSILQAALHYSSSAFCPIIVDAPNQQGQDAGHLPAIIEFLVQHRPDGAQLIVGTEDTFGIEGPEISTINVGVTDKQVLSEGAYEEVSELMAPLFGQLF